MSKRKIFILILLFFTLCCLAIGFVSATKFTEKCPAGDFRHKTVWEIKLNGKEYDKNVKIKGKYYKRYTNFYTKKVIGCKHPSHQKYNLMQGQPRKKPFTYQLWGKSNWGKKPQYSYKLIKDNQVVKVTTKEKFIKTQTVKEGSFEKVYNHYKVTKKTLYGNGKTKTLTSTRREFSYVKDPDIPDSTSFNPFQRNKNEPIVVGDIIDLTRPKQTIDQDYLDDINKIAANSRTPVKTLDQAYLDEISEIAARSKS
ncbi:MAG: hypothetical protein FWC41_09340 [Firmicutes bacterium]|nr:hypothetical protein [Bacillota bacterium]MCL2312668.1 hypothetical protein [Bacillota bacterium]